MLRLVTITYTVTDYAGNITTGTTVAPAGIAGIRSTWALIDLSADHIGAITVNIAGVPSGWTLSEGTNNGDGSWTVVTNDIASL